MITTRTASEKHLNRFMLRARLCCARDFLFAVRCSLAATACGNRATTGATVQPMAAVTCLKAETFSFRQANFVLKPACAPWAASLLFTPVFARLVASGHSAGFIGLVIFLINSRCHEN